jgi:hypothetical protein
MPFPVRAEGEKYASNFISLHEVQIIYRCRV